MPKGSGSLFLRDLPRHWFQAGQGCGECAPISRTPGLRGAGPGAGSAEFPGLGHLVVPGPWDRRGVQPKPPVPSGFYESLVLLLGQTAGGLAGRLGETPSRNSLKGRRQEAETPHPVTTARGTSPGSPCGRACVEAALCPLGARIHKRWPMGVSSRPFALGTGHCSPWYSPVPRRLWERRKGGSRTRPAGLVQARALGGFWERVA